MKSWTLSDELQARPELAAAVERLRPVVDGYVVPPRAGALVSAAWRLEADATGRDAVVLKLTDPFWPAGYEGRFAPRELDPVGPLLRERLLRVWGGLLQAINDEQIDRLLQETEAD